MHRPPSLPENWVPCVSSITQAPDDEIEEVSNHEHHLAVQSWYRVEQGAALASS